MSSRLAHMRAAKAEKALRELKTRFAALCPLAIEIDGENIVIRFENEEERDAFADVWRTEMHKRLVGE